MQTITDAVGSGPIRITEEVHRDGWQTRTPADVRLKALDLRCLTSPDAEAWCANDNRRAPRRRRQWFTPHRCRPDIPTSDTGFICDNGYTAWRVGQIHTFIRDNKADYLRRLREEHAWSHPTVEDADDCRVQKPSRPRRGSVVVLCRGIKMECGAQLPAGVQGKVITKPDADELCEVQFSGLTVLTRRDNLKRPPPPPSCDFLARLRGRNEPPEALRLAVVTFMLPEPANDNAETETDTEDKGKLRWPLQRFLLSKTTGSHEQRMMWLTAARSYEELEAASNTNPHPFKSSGPTAYGTRKLAGSAGSHASPAIDCPEDVRIDVQFDSKPRLAEINKGLGRYHLKIIQWAVVEKLTIGAIGERLNVKAGRHAEVKGKKEVLAALEKLASILGLELSQIFYLGI